LTSSTPNYYEFLPLAQQAEVIYDVHEFDYNQGIFEFMLSGAVGSSKSLALTHLILDHCLQNEGAVVGIGRLALPRLKETLCQKIREHLTGTGIAHSYNESSGGFKFPNKSKIIPFSWSDKKYEKFRSYELSAMVFEELSENHGEHKKAYMEAVARVGRLRHVRQKFVGSATNPDSPSHWAYNYFIENASPSRKTYYSITTDNPFLPKSYVDNLLEIYDAKMAQRMIYGKWIEIADEVIYYAYDRDVNFRNHSYEVVQSIPVCVSFDFNIAIGKPLSIAFMQHHSGQTHVYNEIAIEGLRTRQALEEAFEKGLLKKNIMHFINGDAAGNHRDTRNNLSDYDIIEEFFKEKNLPYQMRVPRSNPAIKERHNLVNGRIRNAKDQVNLFVYKDALTADKGFRLTRLKNGANYIEDDSKEYQHITTAIGYSLCYELYEELENKVAVIAR
jgi:hypothetical protein